LEGVLESYKVKWMVEKRLKFVKEIVSGIFESDFGFNPAAKFIPKSGEKPYILWLLFGPLKVRLSCHYPNPVQQVARCRYLIEIITFYTLKNTTSIARLSKNPKNGHFAVFRCP
jgi:hypothetical protein